MHPPNSSPEFEALLNYLKHNRECDLTGYKRSTLMRRFEHRMQRVGIESYQNYLHYLQCHVEESNMLLQDVLINFTGFFRDREAWIYLATEIVPELIANKPANAPIRVWSAGCSTGQEIYSFLILMSEVLGIEFCQQHIQCYATDADEAALQQAQTAIYSDLEIIGISAELLEKYFQKTEQGYVFYPDLRCLVQFQPHNVMQPAPVSKIDLLICRNVLMYFTGEAQASILDRFHQALRNTGFLFLGQAEALMHRKEFFSSVAIQHRIYTKSIDPYCEDHGSISSQHHQKQAIEPPISQNYFWQTAFESSPVAQVAIDDRGYMAEANEQATLIFGLTLDDWNRPVQDRKLGELLKPYTSIDSLLCQHHSTILKDVEWVTAETTRYFDVAIAPVFDATKQFRGITLTFLDKTDYQQLINQLEHITAELKQVSATCETTQPELEAANQETQLLTENILDRN